MADFTVIAMETYCFYSLYQYCCLYCLKLLIFIFYALQEIHIEFDSFFPSDSLQLLFQQSLSLTTTDFDQC